jgi:hypothetical protein
VRVYFIILYFTFGDTSLPINNLINKSSAFAFDIIILNCMSSTPVTQQPAPQKSATDAFLDSIQPFVIGGLSGMFATCIIQPVDMIKVTIQLKS